jgi:hypothetical protein
MLVVCSLSAIQLGERIKEITLPSTLARFLHFGFIRSQMRQKKMPGRIRRLVTIYTVAGKKKRSTE